EGDRRLNGRKEHRDHWSSKRAARRRAAAGGFAEAKFPGGLSGSWTSRDEGAEKYRDVIAAFAEKGLQDRQRRLADLWRLYNHRRREATARQGILTNGWSCPCSSSTSRTLLRPFPTRFVGP